MKFIYNETIKSFYSYFSKDRWNEKKNKEIVEITEKYQKELIEITGIERTNL